jgi:hypothetical protein
MAFQTPITAKQAVDRIHRREYVLPAIQREFVWKPDQIIRLFDSLLKGFPIGSFLLWELRAENKGAYQFYNFIQRYHERDSTHNPKADLSGVGDVTAILDGQQRLTSLYIGLKGSYAEKTRYSWRRNNQAFPERRLYLNLSRPANDAELTFEFAFRTDATDFVTDEQGAWIRIGHVLEFTSLGDVINFLRQHELLTEQFPQDALTALHTAVNDRKVINYYVEDSQDLDKVLTIFIRVNSAGTVLSYSDLLLSIATAQWTTLDAREEIQRLVDDINRVGSGFTFTKDFVLKTCLMLGGFETRFATDNFKSENMQRIEAMWAKIAAATRTTARLLAEFGFSGETLPSTNAVIPIVHYVYLRGNPDGLVESSSYKADRDHIRRWLNIALLKRVFTGQPDSILRAVRDALDGNSSDGFPSEAIVDALRSKPRSMRFEGEEVDKIIDEKYGSGYTFATLALLYPWLDFRNHFHQDHIHPKSHFTRAQLARRGVTDSAAVADYSERYDRIPNLQLLQGVPNQEKFNKPFVDWLKEQYPLEDERRAYMRQHDIPDVDPSMGNFLNFYEARRELMATRLREIVGLNGSSATAPVASADV